MPKKVFWPVAMILMGLIVLASNLGLLPREFWNLWPLILITVGLGALLTSDRDGWMVEITSGKSTTSAKTAVKKSPPAPAKKKTVPARKRK